MQRRRDDGSRCPRSCCPSSAARAGDSWSGLLDLSETTPDGWCLVGGFMVLLHCLERGAVPTRPTDDGDMVVDLRARPSILRDVTGALVRLGFAADGITADGHQHRWIRGGAIIDVLSARRDRRTRWACDRHRRRDHVAGSRYDAGARSGAAREDPARRSHRKHSAPRSPRRSRGEGGRALDSRGRHEERGTSSTSAISQPWSVAGIWPA